MKLVATEKNILILDKMLFINTCLIIETLQSYQLTSIFKHLSSFALYSHFIVQNFPHLNKTLSVYFTDLVLLLPSSYLFPDNIKQNLPSLPIFIFPTSNQEQSKNKFTVFFLSAIYLKCFFLSVLYSKSFSKIHFYTRALIQYLFS